MASQTVIGKVAIIRLRSSTESEQMFTNLHLTQLRAGRLLTAFNLNMLFTG